VRVAEKEWRRAPFLDGERGEAGGVADDNGEALLSETTSAAPAHDFTIQPRAAKARSANLSIPINLLLTITAQHCLITKSRLGLRSEGTIDRSSWGRA
jgi:hypothetical protein